MPEVGRATVGSARRLMADRLAGLLPGRADWAAMLRHPHRDVLAGLSVAVVALPLALAYGASSGLGAQAGLATAVVAGAIAAIFGGGALQVSGPTGVAIAVLAALEGLLSAAVVDAMGAGRRSDADRELFGQGLANLAVPLVGGIPATATLARTAVNVRCGATSRLASLTHAVALAVIAFVAGGLVSAPRSPPAWSS